MDYEIEPNLGVRGLPLGSGKSAVHEFFGAEPQVFRRSPGSEPADHWPSEGVFAYYDAAGQLEALEFASPAAPRLNGVTLNDADMSETASFLRSLDPDVLVEEGGTSVSSKRLGIGLWSPVLEPGLAAEAVMVCGRGYFDKVV